MKDSLFCDNGSVHIGSSVMVRAYQGALLHGGVMLADGNRQIRGFPTEPPPGQQPVGVMGLRPTMRRPPFPCGHPPVPSSPKPRRKLTEDPLIGRCDRP